MDKNTFTVDLGQTPGNMAGGRTLRGVGFPVALGFAQVWTHLSAISTSPRKLARRRMFCEESLR